jgi:hypothetical protein
MSDPYNSKPTMCSDSEIDKMEQAMRCRVAGKRGFEGCINWREKRGCTFSGFYLAKYTREGECPDCALKSHPELYQGCALCGRAQKSSGYCYGCFGYYEGWLFALFFKPNVESKTGTSTYDTNEEGFDYEKYKAVCHGVHTIVKYVVHESVPIRIPDWGSSKEWVGFDGHKPDPFVLKPRIDISDITYENSADVLVRELKKLPEVPPRYYGPIS